MKSVQAVEIHCVRASIRADCGTEHSDIYHLKVLASFESEFLWFGLLRQLLWEVILSSSFQSLFPSL